MEGIAYGIAGHAIFAIILTACRDTDWRKGWNLVWPVMMAPIALLIMIAGVIFWTPITAIAGAYAWLMLRPERSPDYIDRTMRS